jgi:glycosyltransferase involved in cell wall biosynthesis
MITYNHERFVAQAIESVLAQRGPFSIELVVGEDCSTDATRAIVQRFAGLHPEVVRPLLPTKNLGMRANFRATLAACRGEYVALLEGDDYWTDPEKLARQVALLDSEPSTPACAHPAEYVDAEGNRAGTIPPSGTLEPALDFARILEANRLPTASLVYRRALLPDLPAWTEGLYMSDWPTQLELARHGPIRTLPQIMSAYRWHPDGAWNGSAPVKRLAAMVEFYDRVEAHFPAARNAMLFSNRKETILELIKAADATGRRDILRHWIWRYWKAPPQPGRLPPGQHSTILRALCGWPKRAEAPRPARDATGAARPAVRARNP